jgi:hypothetical protein
LKQKKTFEKPNGSFARGHKNAWRRERVVNDGVVE